jgi:hypothetical protein
MAGETPTQFNNDQEIANEKAAAAADGQAAVGDLGAAVKDDFSPAAMSQLAEDLEGLALNEGLALISANAPAAMAVLAKGIITILDHIGI